MFLSATSVLPVLFQCYENVSGKYHRASFDYFGLSLIMWTDFISVIAYIYPGQQFTE